MIHNLTHELSETIRGMKVTVKVKAPYAATVTGLLSEFSSVIDDARENPSRFGLPDPDAEPVDPNQTDALKK